MRKFTCLITLVFLLGLLSPITSKAEGLSDISDTYTFYDEVFYLLSKNVISGFPDGTFRANETVTRGQVAIMIGRALGFNGEPRNTQFADVNTNVTGSGYIASAVEEGIISGFPDGSYRPYEAVTRGQMAIFLNRAYTLTTGETNSFTDVSSNMSAYQAILNVAFNGIASGYPDGSYRPYQSVTRGQFSAFMARTIEPSFRAPIQTDEKPEPITEPQPIIDPTYDRIYNLTDDQIEEAIERGKQGDDYVNAGKKTFEYDLPFIKDEGNLLYENSGHMSMVRPYILTPYLDIMTQSYLKSIQYEDYSIDEAKKSIDAQKDSLHFVVDLYGSSLTFHQKSIVVLRQNGEIIHPELVSGQDELAERTGLNFPQYMKRLVVRFDSNKINFSEKAELIVDYIPGSEYQVVYDVDFDQYK
ncbi:S-layer homology domain-containing protein [Niallia oryzisoli]|uniref:S-layer homology domain-containing protein n=1 Tax=Niallia oryzisoli TaxID=1737571 RepID=A0ABZ2CPR7_9BACI